MTTILSLFDYSGTWSAPYKQAGYNVIQIDVKLGQDIFALDLNRLPEIHGILAAPPCTDFASSGAMYFKEKDLRGDTRKSLRVIDRTLEIINYLTPVWWALENPVGRLWKFRPQLKPWYFQPCDYGDPYTKKTGIAGNFIPPLPLFIGGDWSVYPTEGSKMNRLYGGKSERTKMMRSITPSGFAKAFFLANP